LYHLDHPGVVNYFETYDSRDYIYLVMQYLEGEDLSKRYESLKKKGQRLSEKALAQMFHDLLEVVIHYQS